MVVWMIGLLDGWIYGWLVGWIDIRLNALVCCWMESYMDCFALDGWKDE